MLKSKIYITIIIIFVLAFLAAGFVYPGFKIFGKEIRVPYMPEVPFKLGLDLQGGSHLIYEADFSGVDVENKTQAMEGLRDVIERRVNFFGVREPIIQIQGERLIIELAGVIDPAQAIKEIGKTPFLEFREQKENYEEILKKNTEIAETNPEQMEDPFQPTSLTGRYLKKSKIDFDQQTYQQPLVLLEFDEEGAKIFESLTEKNIGKRLAIYIDGIPLSAPNVNEKISGGNAQISGSFTNEEAKNLVRNLNAGALPLPITLISQQNVGPMLGKIYLEKSLRAGIYGFLAVIIFMILFYRLPGVLAVLALIIYALFILSLLKLASRELTLAGIAGLVLSIGMAVDANVLIFSRMREELKSGKNFSQSIEEGFNRAWPAIRDGNFTTLIVAIILFIFGTSFIKGFATTLGMGVILSMISAVVITKNFLTLFVGTKLEKLKWFWR